MTQINCSKCGLLNQATYKMCLGCGHSLAVILEPLVERAAAQGRFCYVETYRDGKEPIKAELLFHDPEDAAECARVLNAAKKPLKT
jgi:hypothetical protein